MTLPNTRLVITSSLVILTLSGCAIHPPISPGLSTRINEIKTVAVSPPYVVGYIKPYRLNDTRRVSLPDAAASNTLFAVHEQFGKQGFFVLQDMDLRTSELAPPAPPWAVYKEPDSNAAGYGPCLIAPEGMHFKPKASTASAPEAGVDAVLFTFAWEETTTGGGIFKKNNPLVIWLMPIELGIDSFSSRPDSFFLRAVTRREVCMGLCLIDCRTGEVLWSDIETTYGLGRLEDPETAKALLSKAYNKFTRSVNVAPEETRRR